MIARVLDSLVERAVVRRLPSLPALARVPVVAIGGATLGGSGKTPLAIACAAELARAGARAVLVGHAYRAAPSRARFVEASDPLGEVGDEALVAARALAPVGGRVVVGPDRPSAMAYGAASADVLVLDGVAQLGPRRASLALLAVDAADPWGGAPAALPYGRLRAPLRMLVAACDAIVPVGTGAGTTDIPRARRPMWPADVESRGAWVDGGALLTWDKLRPLRVGLLLALARPERLVRALRQRGIVPQAVIRAPDHGPFGAWALWRAARIERRRAVDLWLATAKCAFHAARALPGLRVGVLDHGLLLHPELQGRLRRVLA